jgi:hypothetical protein
MTELNGKAGFASPAADTKFIKRRHAGVELIATVALAISLVIAATAVSIGAARAQVLGAVGDGRSASFAIAAFVGLTIAGVASMGSLTAMAVRDRAAGRD